MAKPEAWQQTKGQPLLGFCKPDGSIAVQTHFWSLLQLAGSIADLELAAFAAVCTPHLLPAGIAMHHLTCRSCSSARWNGKQEQIGSEIAVLLRF